MKLTIFLLIALFTVSLAEPSCDLDSMCMSCDGTTADKCLGCYNGVVATYGARFLASDSCAGKITDMTDCSIFYPANTAATVSQSTTLQTPCWACSSGNNLSFNPDSDVTATNTAHFLGNLKGPWKCDTTALTAPANCAVGFQLTQDGQNGTAGPACLIYADGYCGNASVVAAAHTIDNCTGYTNCKNTINVWTGSNQAVQQCHNAASGYAVGVGGLAGVAYTTDTNCRKLLDATNCGTCTDGYWFGGAKCYMQGSLYFLSAAAFLAAWFF